MGPRIRSRLRLVYLASALSVIAALGAIAGLLAVLPFQASPREAARRDQAELRRDRAAA